jgi:hypothetical protein
MVSIHPSVFVNVQCICFQSSLPVYLLLFISCCSTSYLHSFVSARFPPIFLLFVLFCLIIQCKIIQCHFSVIILELYSRYLDPNNTISTTIWQVNKHHKQDCAIFFLSIGSKSLMQSHIGGYLEPISPIGSIEGETTSLQLLLFEKIML